MQHVITSFMEKKAVTPFYGILLIGISILGILALWDFLGLLVNHTLICQKSDSHCIKPAKEWFQNIGLSLAAILLFCLAVEVSLNIYSLLNKDNPPTIPKAWEAKKIKGGYIWQGKLHLLNSHGFRGPEWPARREDVFRIMLIGDSFTYGQGIAWEDTYGQVLERMLSRKYNVETINLACCGDQPEGIKMTAQKYFDKIRPDLVIYGLCLNDLTVTKHKINPGRKRYAIPVNDEIKEYCIENTMLFNWLDRKYNDFLIRSHLRMGFYEDVLDTIEQNPALKVKIIRILYELNEFVKSKGLPPIVGMVVNHNPANENGLKLIKIAEDSLLRSGYIVQHPLPYFQDAVRNKIQLYVSSWEHHPNEYCNRLFAKALYDALVSNDDIRGYMEKYKKVKSEGEYNAKSVSF